ncbi:putative AAA domain-containing protein [Cladobotryum mycophilum]|uniref:AAA domain-containing protein n=1 Tax=Cladobotryum mycophilum TaxID=491253 RepID=A0ABR0SUG8_9HYPO
MPRSQIVTALQKAYDDGYLSCSTAVFYESQGNEAEAMRHWKSALDHMREHRTPKSSSTTQGTQSDTEKALMEAIEELELQCKERIDLLEALEVSRQPEFSTPLGIKSINGIESGVNSPLRSKFIGQGTIPAVTYSELSRPVLPKRPSLLTQRSSENVIAGVNGLDVEAATGSSSNNGSYCSGVTLKQEKATRSSSPEKHTMRTTLRSGKPGEKLNKATRKSSKHSGEGSSKAATLAWSTFGSRDSLHRASSHDTSFSSSLPFHQSAERLLKPRSSPVQWDSNSRRLVSSGETELVSSPSKSPSTARRSSEYSPSWPSLLSVSAASNALGSSSTPDSSTLNKSHNLFEQFSTKMSLPSPSPRSRREDSTIDPWNNKLNESPEKRSAGGISVKKKSVAKDFAHPSPSFGLDVGQQSRYRHDGRHKPRASPLQRTPKDVENHNQAARSTRGEGNLQSTGSNGKPEEVAMTEEDQAEVSWAKRKAYILKNLPPGIDEIAARQILNDIVIQGDEVHWGDIAGLEIAKNALRETVVYPFLRPDLFMGLREPARGMLLFGPPGTGKTMLARAVATESRSTFFSISASSLTSKYLGESEKLVKALFGLARALAPSIIFVDEIDSLLSQRSGSGEHEATRRIKTEFLIQWSDLQRAVAGRETTEKDKERGDANRVLVLAATNLPWAIDEAARRRFVRRQYIPLPEPTTRETQLGTLLGQQKHNLSADDIDRLVQLTNGFSGSDITALAKDAAMGPLRSLGEALLHMTMDDIRPIQFVDFEASLCTIRPSVSKNGLKEYEDWAKEFGERGG